MKTKRCENRFRDAVTASSALRGGRFPATSAFVWLNTRCDAGTGIPVKIERKKKHRRQRRREGGVRCENTTHSPSEPSFSPSLPPRPNPRSHAAPSACPMARSLPAFRLAISARSLATSRTAAAADARAAAATARSVLTASLAWASAWRRDSMVLEEVVVSLVVMVAGGGGWLDPGSSLRQKRRHHPRRRRPIPILDARPQRGGGRLGRGLAGRFGEIGIWGGPPALCALHPTSPGPRPRHRGGASVRAHAPREL